jgi:hypothetical protein
MEQTMSEADRDRSRSPAAARGKWSLLNGWVPSRDRDSFDGKWAIKQRFTLWAQEQSIPEEERGKNRRSREALVNLFGATFIQLGCSRTALTLAAYDMARLIVPPNRGGRPRGSRNHEPKHLDDLKAIAREVVSSPPYHNIKSRREGFDREWARNTRRRLREEEKSNPYKEQQRTQRGREALFGIFVTVFSQLDNTMRAALALAFYDVASFLALLDQGGRPRGSRTHSPEDLDNLKAIVVAREKDVGLDQAIKDVLANALPEHRSALRKHLRRTFPSVRTKKQGQNCREVLI